MIQGTEVAHIFGVPFPQVKFRINFDKNGLGSILGDFFHQLIWSHWARGLRERKQEDLKA
jgi:hypothetical protein